MFYRSYQKPNDLMVQYSYTCVIQKNSTTNTVVFTHTPLINNVSFNYPVIIGNYVNNAANTFRNCTSFNQDVHIPNNVADCRFMLADCPNYGSDIYYHGTIENYNRWNNTLLNKNNSKRVNVYVVNSINMNRYRNNLINTSIQWTKNGANCCYNDVYNIYIYNTLTE